jgi:hypothetical protein
VVAIVASSMQLVHEVQELFLQVKVKLSNTMNHKQSFNASINFLSRIIQNRNVVISTIGCLTRISIQPLYATNPLEKLNLIYHEFTQMICSMILILFDYKINQLSLN